MLEGHLTNLVQKLLEKASALFDEYLSCLSSVKELIIEHFGHNGLIATYIVLGVLIVVIITRLVKITFAAVKYLIIPSIALAFVGSIVLPYSFFILLPVTVTACSLILLFRG